MATVASKTSLQNGGQMVRAVAEPIDDVDYKMVTFSLAGKDYGINIMKIKEIAKFVNFTYVPNAPHFVRGVYNLRGEIISVIDLRALFNLPFEAKEEQESGLILRLDQNMLGIIVDKIDKVIGIAAESIQPPHPIFGDINVKYISGVVENGGRLYIILDVERILGRQTDDSDGKEAFDKLKADRGPVKSRKADPGVGDYDAAGPNAISPPARGSAVSAGGGSPAARSTGGATGTRSGRAAGSEVAALTDVAGDNRRKFVIETLQTFRNFYVADINETWFDHRFAQWIRERSGAAVQLQSVDDADLFLAPFLSEFTGAFWQESYVQRIVDLLPETMPKMINVWNPGCGKGFESFSIAMLFKSEYPESRVKVWASDKDLMYVSNAPSLTFPLDAVPERFRPFVVESKDGFQASAEIRDSILFEYHDILNPHSMPPLDLVVCRDVLSFFPAEKVRTLVAEIAEKVKIGGLLLVGTNEKIVDSGWSPIGGDTLKLFQKR